MCAIKYDGDFCLEEDIEYEDVIPVPALNLPELKVLGCKQPVDTEDYYVFHCKPLNKNKMECSCRIGKVYSNGHTKNERLVRDISMGMKSVFIYVEVPRYKCQQCNRTYNHVFVDIMPKRQFTLRLYEQIKIRALNNTFLSLAAEYGLSDTTIAEILREYGKELDAKHKLIAPRVLGIDEKHIKNDMRGVFVDIENGVLLEMTKDNKQETIQKLIESMENYDTNIEIVTMDMSRGYKSVIEYVLPKAVIVIDKYHIIQQLQRETTKTKTKLLPIIKKSIEEIKDDEEREKKMELYKKMAKNSYFFRFSPDRVAAKAARASMMAEVCLAFPEINTLRYLRDGIYEMYNAKTREDAEKIFEEWQTHIPKNVNFAAFAHLAKTIKNWKKEIFEYFEKGHRFTNAATEGLNSLIGVIDTNGRGYSFENLRIKCLYNRKAKISPKILKSKKYIFDGKPITSFWTPDAEIFKYKLVEEEVETRGADIGILKKVLNENRDDF